MNLGRRSAHFVGAFHCAVEARGTIAAEGLSEMQNAIAGRSGKEEIPSRQVTGFFKGIVGLTLALQFQNDIAHAVQLRRLEARALRKGTPSCAQQQAQTTSNDTNRPIIPAAGLFHSRSEEHTSEL